MASALLSDSVRRQLRGALGGLPEAVCLRLLLHGSTPNPELQESQALVRGVVEEIAAAGGERVAVEIVDLDGHDPGAGAGVAPELGVPAIEISAPETEASIAYLGIPGGYEFGALIDTVQRMGRRDPGLRAASLRRLEEMDVDAEIMVFVTPSCPYCPVAAALAFRLAMASPRVRALTVEATEFPELAGRHGVSGVPHVVVNRSGSFVGALPEDHFVAEVARLARAHPRAA